MGILTAFFAMLSCALIGAGVWLVLQDARKGRTVRTHLLPRHEEMAPAENERLHASPAEGQSTEVALSAGAGPLLPGSDPLEADLILAIRAVNGAFAPAGITLTRETGALQHEGGTPRFQVALMAGERRAGVLSVTRAGDELEIKAASDTAPTDVVARARRLARHEANIPSLAEAIAACAWPVVTALLSPKSKNY